MRCLTLLSLLLAGTAGSVAHDAVTTKLTWNAEISRIVYRRCVGCHGANGPGPMSLIQYRQARPWAVAIRNQVLNRSMPPWGAIRGYRDLLDDRSLTQDEILTIAQWVNGGAPEGDANPLPPVGLPQQGPSAPTGRLVVTSRVTADSVLLGIRPPADVEDARVTAHLPDGTVEPLIWLHGYRAKWNRTFTFREPLRLPRGTRIVSDPPTRLQLLFRQ